MNYIKKEFYFDSYSGIAKIHAASYYPTDEKVEGIFQIVHGMAEHFERYEAFIEQLCGAGFVVYTHDHLGHGLSVSSKDKLGYFGKKDGWKNFIEDAHILTKMAKEENPELPLIFFGHSMGSFVARNYSAKYADDIDGVILCGTAGPQAILKVATVLIKVVKAFKGEMHRSKFIDKIAFGAYNKRCEGRTAFDWLSRDNEQVDKYIADEYCGFLFTAAGYLDMINLIISVSENAWFDTFPKKLPTFIISGSEDPVGEYGKGIENVFNKLKAKGKESLEMKLYKDARHEILNEKEYFKEVCSDVIGWAKDKIKG